MHCSKQILKLSVIMVAGLVLSARADLTLVEDTFTDPNGTALENRAPDTVNLPGGTWQRANPYWPSSIQNNTFNSGADAGWTVPLSDNAAHARPSRLRVSADLKLNTLTDGGGGGGGWGLGFNTVDGGSYHTFTGLVLHQNGTLKYREEGSDKATVAWAGPAFVTTNFYNLSYEVDTLSGAMTNIALENSSADFSALVAAAGFSTARTPFAGIYGNAGGSGQNGFIDNYKIERTGDALPPMITLLSPSDGATYTPEALISAATTLIDGTGPLSLQFYVDGVAAGSAVTNAPYEATLGPLSNGTYAVHAVVADSDLPTNAVAFSGTNTISVQTNSGLYNVDFAQNISATYVGDAAIGETNDTWNPVNLGYPTDRPQAATYAPTVVQLADSAGAISGVTLTETWVGNGLVNVAGTAAFNATEYQDLMIDGVGYDYTLTLTGLTPGTYDVYLYSPFGWSRYIVNGVQNIQRPFSNSDVLADHTVTLHPVVGLDGTLTIEPLNHNDHIDKLSGFQFNPVPDNTAPVVTLLSPTNSQLFSMEAEITAVADFYYGTAPYTVEFYVDALLVGTLTNSMPPHQLALGSLALGPHAVFARVIDSSAGDGPFAVDSPTNTITVAVPAITVDKVYTFNAGAEPELIAGFWTGSEPPLYVEGQVSLPSGTRLKGKGVLPMPAVNTGVEVILTQTSDTTEHRYVAAVGNGSPYQFLLYGKSRLVARDDHQGEYATYTPPVTVGAEYRMAMISTHSPGDANIVKLFYVDGVLRGTSTVGASDNKWTANMDHLWVGGWSWNDGQTGNGTPSLISVNEVRIFHFEPTMFSSNLLLSAATPVPDQAPEITLLTPLDNQPFLTFDPLVLSAGVAFGTPPFTVKYFMRPLAGAFAQVGGDATNAPFTVDLGVQGVGSYELFAEVYDSEGMVRSGTSTTHTFTVTAPTRSTVLDYTFNNGMEPDFTGGEGNVPGRLSNTNITYAEAMVHLEGNAWLDTTVALPPVNDDKIIIEVIFSYPVFTQNRTFGFIHLTGGGGLGFRLTGGRAYGYSDQFALLPSNNGYLLEPNTQVRLAYVHDSEKNPADQFYVDGVAYGDPRDGNEFGTFGRVRLGSKATDNDPNVPTAISVDQYRVSTFTGAFHPSVLLTRPTPPIEGVYLLLR
ncbi:MAG: hypothetical protein ACI856_002452 [Kiritimatiellia bacterium]|jgi:hypothetical protein